MKKKSIINSNGFLYFQQNLEYISLSLFVASSAILFIIKPDDKSQWYLPLAMGIVYAISYVLKYFINYVKTYAPLLNLGLIFPELVMSSEGEEEDFDAIKKRLIKENESLLIELNKLEEELILLKKQDINIRLN